MNVRSGKGFLRRPGVYITMQGANPCPDNLFTRVAELAYASDSRSEKLWVRIPSWVRFRGGNGIRTGLKILLHLECEFESHRKHINAVMKQEDMDEDVIA